jgi:hypothetical protein
MATVSPDLRRRAFLHALAAGAFAGAGLPGCVTDETPPAATATAAANPTFFTADERAAFAALVDVVLPPDDTPGAGALGVVEYVERLVTAFEAAGVPRYLLGGPYSGRVPFPDASGAPSASFPPSGFTTWLPLDRYAAAELRLHLHGSAGVPGGGPNDLVLGPTVGLRELLRAGLEQVIAAAGGSVAAIDTATVTGLSPDFQAALLALVCEGVLGAPEYGGNAGGAGWRLANFPGDALPLGYTFYDPITEAYRERISAPVSTADAGPDPAPLDAETLATLDALVLAMGGTKFS